jgi:hypothetical protein
MAAFPALDDLWLPLPRVFVAREVVTMRTVERRTVRLWAATPREPIDAIDCTRRKGNTAMRDARGSARPRPVRPLITLLGCVGAMTLLGACGGASAPSTGPTGTSAKSAPPSSWASVSTTPAALPADLASFAGSWHTHDHRLVIDSAGHGHYSYSDFTRCPNCSMADAPTSTVDFTLTSVSDGVASGSVTAASHTERVGAPVLARLAPGIPKGEFLQLKVGADGAYGNYCNDISDGADCGA